MNYKLLVLDINKDECILQYENGPKLIWPLLMLPKDIKVGDFLSFNILKSDSKEVFKKDNQLAKDILNEILNV